MEFEDNARPECPISQAFGGGTGRVPEGVAMDRILRRLILMSAALILCAHPSMLSGQESGSSGSPGVNAPKSISERFPSPQNVAVPSSFTGAAEENAETQREQPPTWKDSSTDAVTVQTPLKRRLKNDTVDDQDSGSDPSGGSSAGAVLITLVVLLLFALGLARLFLKRSPYSVGGLPPEAVDVLGRRALDPRNSVYIVKIGSRMLLLGSSSGGLSTLSEINDPIEVASLANICAASQRSIPDAARWLGKLWAGRTSEAETRSFDDQLGERLFDEAQRGETARVDSLTVNPGREQHRAG